MKRWIWLVVVLVCAGCALKSQPTAADLARQEQLAEEARRTQKAEERRAREQQDLEQAVAEATGIFETMLRSIDEDDYESFIGVCNPSMRSMYRDRDMFLRENLRRRELYGLSGARPVARAEKKNPYYIVEYLVRFSKLDDPVPVTLYLKKEEQGLVVALIQYGFAKVMRPEAVPHSR